MEEKYIQPNKTIAYLCDKKACSGCLNLDCSHCLDIKHAENFRKITDDYYEEKPKKNWNLLTMTDEEFATFLDRSSTMLFHYAMIPLLVWFIFQLAMWLINIGGQLHVRF